MKEGDCFELNGVHFENQLSDIVLQNQNFNFNYVETTTTTTTTTGNDDDDETGYEKSDPIMSAPPGSVPVRVKEVKVGEGCVRFIKYGPESKIVILFLLVL